MSVAISQYLVDLVFYKKHSSVFFIIFKISDGKAGISAAMALKLAKAFKTTRQYWMNLQANYDLWQASKDVKIQNVPELVS